MGDQALAMSEDGVVSEDNTAYGKRLDDVAIRSALANYNKALRIMPECIDAMVGKAKLLMAIDQMESAEQELTTALEIDKHHYASLMAMGELMEAMRDVPEASRPTRKLQSRTRNVPNRMTGFKHI